MLRRLLVTANLIMAASAWTTSISSRATMITAASTSSRVSSFGGSVLLTPSEGRSSTAGPQLEMKKGKPNVPPQMRSQYKRQQEMQELRQRMIQASTPGSDGLPVFNLFVRTKRANMWYPCGSFKGDDKSAALAKSYADGGLLAGISKKQIDSGVAGSLWRDLDKLKESVSRAYPQLRKSADEFEFGYRLAFEGLSEDKEQMVIVEPKESKGVFDNIKGIFSGN